MTTREDVCCVPQCATRRSARFKAQLCDHHAFKVFNEVREAVGEAIGGMALNGAGPQEKWTPRPGFVYFATVGELIKIGYSTTPKKRVRDLGGKMIGYQSGTRNDERAFHFRFGAYWSHGEYFRNEGDLAEFVDMVRLEW